MKDCGGSCILDSTSALGNSNWYVAVYISLYIRPTRHLKIFIQGQKTTLNYSRSVAAPGFTRYALADDFTHDKRRAAICSTVRSGFEASPAERTACSSENTLPAADCYLLFSFPPTSCPNCFCFVFSKQPGKEICWILLWK